MGEARPDLRWPAQFEIRAGRHFVRPRYEITNRAGRRRINHANVERVDLRVDENLPELSRWLGKGYILPAPILPRARFASECLPTPMSTAQLDLPLAAAAYNARGEEIGRRFLGRLPRAHESLVNLTALAAALGEDESGHVELTYDFSDGGGGDGWMHALFRYTDKAAGHAAETSFGAHMFNHPLTYKNEPQSYKGPPPGLTTRLFLRLTPPPVAAFCHLIYPVGVEWNPLSDTRLTLKNKRGEDVAEKTARIAAGGSFAFFLPRFVFGGRNAPRRRRRLCDCARRDLPSFRLSRRARRRRLFVRSYVRILSRARRRCGQRARFLFARLATAATAWSRKRAAWRAPSRR